MPQFKIGLSTGDAENSVRRVPFRACEVQLLRDDLNIARHGPMVPNLQLVRLGEPCCNRQVSIAVAQLLTGQGKPQTLDAYTTIECLFGNFCADVCVR